MNSPIRLASAAGGAVLSLLVSSLAFAQTPTAKVLHEFGGADKASPSSNLIQLPASFIFSRLTARSYRFTPFQPTAASARQARPIRTPLRVH